MLKFLNILKLSIRQLSTLPCFQYDSYVHLENNLHFGIFYLSFCFFMVKRDLSLKNSNFGKAVRDAIMLHDHFWFSFLQAKLRYLAVVFSALFFYIFNFVIVFPVSFLNKLAIESDMKFIKDCFTALIARSIQFSFFAICWLLNSTTPSLYIFRYNSAKAKAT
jgi:hypothetical protein